MWNDEFDFPSVEDPWWDDYEIPELDLDWSDWWEDITTRYHPGRTGLWEEEAA